MALTQHKATIGLLAAGLFASALGAQIHPAARHVAPSRGPAQEHLALQASLLPDEEYEWLEEARNPEALAWAQNETEWTIDHINAMPGTSGILDTVRRLAETQPRNPTYSISGGKVFRTQYSSARPRGFLESAEMHDDGSLGEWELFLDVATINEAEGRNFHLPLEGTYLYDGAALGKEGSRYIIWLSEGGSDDLELREIDATTGQVVPNGFNTEKGRVFFNWLDIDHLLISHTTTPGIPTTGVLYPAVWQIWERGTPLSDAPEIHRVEDTSLVAYTFPLGPNDSGRGLLMEFSASWVMRYFILSPCGTVEEITGLPDNLTPRLEPDTTGQHILFVTDEETTLGDRTIPEGTILAYDYLLHAVDSAERLSIVWEPEVDDNVPYIAWHGLTGTQTQVHLTKTRQGVESRLVIEPQDGEWVVVAEVESPPGGMAQMVSCDKHSDHLIISETGLIQPTHISLVGPRGAKTDLFEQPAYFNSDDFVVEALEAESRDGTIVDFLRVSPKSFEGHNSTEGKRPVLMHGYGGFRLSLLLNYLDIHLVPWLESGGSVVYAFIRGGGEKGLEWHQAAQGPGRRQVSFNDFIDVAEKLVSDGFTSPENLGMWGHSGGGLLAGAMYIQRPDLFGAIISDAPVLDVLRYVEMSDAGGAWIPEFGDPSIPEDAELIRQWSPFHNIEAGVDYPPFLTTVANTDDNNGPGHSRKMVAKLRDAGVENAYLYNLEEGGHNILNSYANPTFMGHRTSFFMNYLMI